MKFFTVHKLRKITHRETKTKNKPIKRLNQKFYNKEDLRTGDFTVEHYQTFQTPLRATLKLSNSRKRTEHISSFYDSTNGFVLNRNYDTCVGLNKNGPYTHIFK